MELDFESAALMRAEDPDVYISYIESKLVMLEAENKHLKSFNEVTKKTFETKKKKEEQQILLLTQQNKQFEADVSQLEYECEMLVNTNDQLRDRIEQQKEFINKLTNATRDLLDTPNNEEAVPNADKVELLLSTGCTPATASISLDPTPLEKAPSGLTSLLYNFARLISNAKPTADVDTNVVAIDVAADAECDGSLEPYIPVISSSISCIVDSDHNANVNTVTSDEESSDDDAVVPTPASRNYIGLLNVLSSLINPVAVIPAQEVDEPLDICSAIHTATANTHYSFKTNLPSSNIHDTARQFRAKTTPRAPTVDQVMFNTKVDYNSPAFQEVLQKKEREDLTSKLEIERLFIRYHTEKMIPEFVRTQEPRRQAFEEHATALKAKLKEDPSMGVEEDYFVSRMNAVYRAQMKSDLDNLINTSLRDQLFQVVQDPKVGLKAREQAQFLLSRRVGVAHIEEGYVKAVQIDDDEYQSVNRTPGAMAALKDIEKERHNRLVQAAKVEFTNKQTQKALALSQEFETYGNDIKSYQGSITPMRIVGTLSKHIEKAFGSNN